MMDPIEIEAPDGTIVEFPAGTSDDEISRVMAQNFPSAPEGEQAAAPNYEIQYGWRGTSDQQQAALSDAINSGRLNPNAPEGSMENPVVLGEGLTEADIQDLVSKGVTFIDREGRWMNTADDELGFYTGGMRPFMNVANWSENAAGAAFGDAGREAVGAARDAIGIPTEQEMDELLALGQRAGVRPGTLGQFGGQVMSTIPVGIATRNPWLVGAAEGALGSNAEDAQGLAMDTAFGALAGRGADAATRIVGTMVAPRLTPAARSLVDQGVELSPGQLAGGLVHRLEDATTGVPGIGEISNAAQRRAEESMNRVAFERPLRSLGVQLPSRNMTTHDMVAFTQNAASQAYDELLPQLRVGLDQQFSADFNQLYQDARFMGSRFPQFQQLVTERVAPYFNPANGRITGESFKELESILGREARDYSASANADDRRYASAVRELQAQLRDLLARSNPEHAERLQSINDAYRQLTVLEDAARRAPEGSRGRFSSVTLGSAAEQADGSVRRRAAARGDSLFQDLSEDSAEVMRRTVADTGTATRGAVTAGLGAAFLGQSLNIAINPWALGALTLGAVPYTRAGNRMFTTMLARRPGFAEPVRQGLEASAPAAALAAGANTSVGRAEDRRDAEDADQIAAMRMMVENAQAAQPQGGM